MGARQVGEQRQIQIRHWVPTTKDSIHGLRFTGASNYINFRLLPAVREK